MGFSQGYRLADREDYLKHGTNKQVYYKIYQSVDEIDERSISILLKEAVELDQTFQNRRRNK
jgi:hypothetical protein